MGTGKYSIPRFAVLSRQGAQVRNPLRASGESRFSAIGIFTVVMAAFRVFPLKTSLLFPPQGQKPTAYSETCAHYPEQAGISGPRMIDTSTGSESKL